MEPSRNSQGLNRLTHTDPTDVEIRPESQGTLDNAQKSVNAKPRDPPQWAKNAWSVTKKIGAVVGIVICGAVSLGTLIPFGIAAVICSQKAQQKQKLSFLRTMDSTTINLLKASVILGAPSIGMGICIDELRGTTRTIESVKEIWKKDVNAKSKVDTGKSKKDIGKSDNVGVVTKEQAIGKPSVVNRDITVVDQMLSNAKRDLDYVVRMNDGRERLDRVYQLSIELMKDVGSKEPAQDLKAALLDLEYYYTQKVAHLDF